MQPVLALELSTDGILLHELSYDGVWRRISAAALSDPFLPKKMVAMKQAARASQGRFFKNYVWLPPDQIKGLEVRLTAQEPDDRQAEAEAIVRADPAFSDGDYIVQFGEEDVNGNVKIAAVNRAVLQEANRFVSGYGFASEDFTSRDRIDGFNQQPYFTISGQPKIAVNYPKVGFFAGTSMALAAIVAGGYWAYTSIDFTPDPSDAIEATEERILEIDEDPRAPIRPTDIAENAERPPSKIISFDDNLEPLPEHDTNVTTFEALVEQARLASSLEIAEVPRAIAPLSAVNVGTPLTETLAAVTADDLPAPETTGFPVTATQTITLASGTAATDFAGGTPMARYAPVTPEAAYVSSPRLTDVLPRDDSTVVLAAQLRKYNDSLGLTHVRENNAALARIARTEALQQAPTNVISGRPAILPVLRGGVQISDVQLPPPPLTLTIAQLQALPPVVTQGFPRITPTLRDGRNVADLPPAPVAVVVEEPAPAETGPDGEPLVQFTTIVSGLTTEQLQRIPPRVFEGRPAILPQLRGGIEVGAVSEVVPEPDVLEEPEPDPELTDAQRLHPLARPDSVELTALVASLSQSAVPSTLSPLHRPAGFAERVKAMADAIAEQARVTPTFTDAPRTVDVPTSANVARTATIEGGINLRETSLIGVFGTPGNYRALLRQRGGKYKMLAVGDKIDGWTIVAIAESEVRLKKGSRTKTLKLPAER